MTKKKFGTEYPKIIAQWQRSKKPPRVWTCQQHRVEFYSVEESERHSKELPHRIFSGRYEIIVDGIVKNYASEATALRYLKPEDEDK